MSPEKALKHFCQKDTEEKWIKLFGIEKGKKAIEEVKADLQSIINGENDPWKELLAYHSAGFVEFIEVDLFHDFLASLNKEKRAKALKMSLKEINSDPEFALK